MLLCFDSKPAAFDVTDIDTNYELSGATVSADNNVVTVVDTLKTTDGEAAGTSTFQIGSENTSIELGAEGNKININLVWGEF